MFDEAELAMLMTILFATQDCPAHGREALNVCVQCHRVSCLACIEQACGCFVSDEEEQQIFWGM